MFPTRHRPLGDIEVTKPASLAERILHCRSADAGVRRHPVDRRVTYALILDLHNDDREPSALALRVMLAERGRQSARAAPTATTLDRGLTIGRPRRPSRPETAAQAALDGCQRFRCDNAWSARRTPPERPSLVGNVGEERRLVVVKVALVVMEPTPADDIVDLVERERGIDEAVKATGDCGQDRASGGGRGRAHCPPPTMTRSNAASASMRFLKRPSSRLRA